jgi:hypothetical protein
MADVSIYVAVIAGSAGILGGLPPYVQATIKARRKRQERHQDAVRQECVGLIRAAWDLRTMIKNNHEYHGDEMGERLAKVRERAADAAVYSAAIAALAPGPLADAAARLASAAQQLAEQASANTDLDMGRSIRAPECGDLESRITKFTEATAAYFGR